MKRFLSLVLTGLSVLALAGCLSGGSSGGGGGGGGGGPEGPDPGEAGVSGRITAPNGETPVSGVTVYYTDGVGGLSLQADRVSTLQSGCAAPPATAGAWACTDEQGYFVLDLGAVELPPGAMTLGFFKGKWSGSASVETLGEYAGVLPFPSNSEDGAPRIAVITGEYDQIESVLVRLGLTSNPAGNAAVAQVTPQLALHHHQGHHHGHGHSHVHLQAGTTPVTLDDDDFDFCDPSEPPPDWWPPEAAWPPEGCDGEPPAWLGSETFDLYIGNREYGEDYPEMSVLFELGDGGVPRLLDYDILYVNCSAPPPDAVNWENMVTQFVEQGGFLYVTDLSSDWVTEPFFSYVSHASGEADTGDTVRVVEPSLRSWLRGVPCGNGNACVDGNGRFVLTGFGDHVLSPLDSSVVALVTDNAGDNALTLSFPHGSVDGQVFFSTFHTADGFFGAGGPTAEERILEYLFFAEGDAAP